MKDYVTIQSNVTIMVTGGLQYKDLTNKDSQLPNRMKVACEWPKLNVLIKQGQHIYPSEIVEWPTVQALQKDGVLTIGAYIDNPNDVEIEKLKETVVEVSKEINTKPKRVKKEMTLDSIIDEE